jgi:hypothetical protein
MKNLHKSHILKKIVAISSAVIISFNSFSFEIADNIDINFDFLKNISVRAEDREMLTLDKFKEIFNIGASTADYDIIMNNAEQLIGLSNVNPSEYANLKILYRPTQGAESASTTVNVGGSDYSFMQIGDKDNPFSGKFVFSGSVTLNNSLFNTVSDNADIEFDNFNISLDTECSEFCLIENVVKGKSDSTIDISGVTISVINDSTVIKGIINKIDSDVNVSLGIKIENSSDEVLTVSCSENAGFICNQIGKNSVLTVNSFEVGESDIEIQSDSGNAGGAVGAMESGSEIIFKCDYEFSGKVSAGKSAGGVVGKAVNSGISLSDDNTISVNGAEINGTSDSGGICGNYTHDNPTKKIALNNINVSDITVSGDNSGGLFGFIENKNGAFEMSYTDTKTILLSVASDNYGGIVGTYKSDVLSNSLVISNVGVNISSGENSNGSGIINIIKDDKAYVKIENVSVNADSEMRAGLVSDAGSGNMLDIGTVTISRGKLKSGLVNKMTSGVMRLSGNTDMSGINFVSDYNAGGQILGTRNSTLVYALTDWNLTRKTGGRISDIGSYGEVVRLKSNVISETKSEFSDNTTELFYFNENAHTVTVHSVVFDIANERDFAALSVSIQMQKSVGALILKNEFTSSEINDDITLKNDIDMSGTGITGLTRDNNEQKYSGTFDGKNNTLILKIGEIYGDNVSNTNTVGAGQIYNHRNIGLFSVISDATIKNVIVGGSMNFGTINSKSDIYAGAIAGEAANSVFESVTSSMNAEFSATFSSYGGDKTVYLGGFVGSVRYSSTIDFNSCKWNGSITNNSLNTLFYNGGFIGYTNSNAKINSSNDTISGSITVNKSLVTVKTGGFIGKSSWSTIVINNLNVQGTEITVASSDSGTAGGLLGYEWYDSNVDINGMTVSGSTLDVKGKTFGGLVYKAEGYWELFAENNTPAITFKEGNSFTGATSQKEPSALLISSDNYYYSSDSSYEDSSLYIEIGAYNNETGRAVLIESQPKITLTGGDYFDELVGITLNGVGHGIVSIETAGDDKYIDTDGNCNTYVKQLDTAYQNSMTRYYYNLDKIRDKSGAGGKSNVDIVVTSGEDLLLWSIYKTVCDNIKGYFAKSVTNNISGKIDLTGLSYYPINISESITVSDATIIFDNKTINDAETNNRQTNDDTLQHYKMQSGLFDNISYGDSATSVTVNNVILKGNIGALSGKSGSGAIVCGKVVGNQSGVNIITTVLSVSGVTLDGIVINNANNDYSPLIINKISSYSSVSVSGVKTISEHGESSLYNIDATTPKVATSLIGNVGGSSCSNISIVFGDMALDSRTNAGTLSKIYGTYNTIFSHAVFLESFEYPESNINNCNGSYTFNSTDTDVTYGQEIANTEGKTVSGRNNGNQYEYFDSGYVYDSEETSKTKPTDAESSYTYFFDGYIRYVYHLETGDYYEIDINQRTDNIISGCGTYGDPYIIKNGAQLENLGNTGFKSNWIIKVNPSVMTDKNGISGYHSSESGDADILIQYQASGWVQVVNDGGEYKKVENGKTYTDDAVRMYLMNGYYMIEPDSSGDSYGITLGGGTFMGIGDASATTSFCGVIIGKEKNGKYPKITIKSPDSSVDQYGGLIRYGMGCVIKDLVIEFDEDITVKYKSTDTNVQKQNFFGGVIGYVWGGDNIIDNVEVIYNNNITTGGDTNDKLINIGGYVGLIGGDYKRGGTVIFRNMTDSNKLSTVNDYNVGSEVTGTNDKYYWNPYVGRVLDAAVFYDGVNSTSNQGTKLSNTDKNYTIPTISNGDKLNVNVWALGNDDSKYDSPTPTITVNSSEQLWILSAICTSGAGAGNPTGCYYHAKSDGGNSSQYQLDSYYFGKVRSGLYNDIGSSTKPDWIDNDEKAWGGIGVHESSNPDYIRTKVPYLIRNFTNDIPTNNDIQKFPAKRITGYGRWFNIDIKADCDMREYGNGFRGMGSSFTKYDIKDGYRQRKAISMKNVSGNNHTITLNRNIYEYSGEKWHTYQAGLFMEVYVHATNGNIENITLSGTITTNNNSDTYIGALAGARKNSTNTANNVVIKNVNVENMTISGSQYAGGLIGIVKYGNEWTFENCSYNNLSISARDCAGGYVGYFDNSTDHKIYVKSTEETVLENGNISVTKSNDVYAGGIFGYVLGKPVLINCDTKGNTIDSQLLKMQHISITCADSSVSKNSYIGGIAGQTVDKTISNVLYPTVINNVELDDITLNSVTKSNVNRAGGLVGYAMGNIIINNASVNNLKILNCGNVGGLIGNAIKNVTISNSSVQNSYLVTHHTSDTKGDTGTGGLIGKEEKEDMSILGYNILLNNNIMGYCMNPSTVDINTIKSFSAETIGIRAKINNKISYYSYASIEKMLDDGTYMDESAAGTIIGKISSNDTVQIVGISVQGKYRPNEEIGSDTYTTTSRNKNSYIIYADYTGASTGGEYNNTSGKKPNVITNPKSVVAGQEDKVVTDGTAWYQADSQSVVQKIVSDAKSDSESYDLIYGKIISQAEKFRTEKITDAETNETVEVTGDYADKLTTYKKADENNSTYAGSDFPVLLIDTNDSASITKMIQNYASVLTNENLSDSYSTALSGIEITTYKLNNNGEFNAVSVPTLKVNSSNVISINSGKHDNDNKQFTVVTLKYQSPTDKNSTYDLQIAVLVKKVLNYGVKAVVKTGSYYYNSAYDDVDSIALANHGEPVTALISFTYERTAEQWETYLNSGENLIGNFDKTIDIDSDGKLPDGTKLTLVDANNPNTDKTSNVQNSQPYYATYTENSKNVTLSDFKSENNSAWSPLSLCDLLGVYVATDEDFADGLSSDTVVFATTNNKSDATAKVGDVYYKRVGTISEIEWGEDSETPTPSTIAELEEYGYVVLKVNPQESQLYTTTVDGEPVQYLCEYYYITIETPDPDDTTAISSRVQIPSGTSALGGSDVDIPVQYDSSLYAEKDSTGKIKEWDFDRYIIGQLYTQELTFESVDDNFEISENNLVITAKYTSEITANKAIVESITSNTAVKINHELDFSLVLSEGTNTEAVQFLPSTSVTVEDYSIEINNQSTVSKDKVVCSLNSSATLSQSGVLTADITNFREFLNNNCTITATVKFEMTPEDYEEQFKNAIRLETGSDKGISPKVYSKLGSSGSYIKSEKTLANRYYISEEASAELTYSADSKELGINPTELETDMSKTSVIRSTAIYNIRESAYKNIIKDVESEDNISRAVNIEYDITLKKKDDNGNYQNVDIKDYLNLMTVTVDDESIDTSGILSEDGKNWIISCPWREENSSDEFKRSQIVKIDFEVNTGSESESGIESFTYANYQVAVTAKLYYTDKNESIKDTSADNHIIYTNARIRIDKLILSE